MRNREQEATEILIHVLQFLCWLVEIVFVILKFDRVIDWHWAIVFIPLMVIALTYIIPAFVIIVTLTIYPSIDEDFPDDNI